MMSSHFPVIVPEINQKNSICDYLIQTASILASKKYPTYIYYLSETPTLRNNISQISSNLYTFTPLKIIPLNRFVFVQKINISLSFIYLYFYCFFHYHLPPIFWFFYPQLSPLLKISPPPAKIIYDIVDYYTSPISKINQRILLQKKILLKKANLVTAISPSLIESYQKIYPHAKINLVPQGFNLISPSTPLPLSFKKFLKLSPKIGYIGAINNRLDFDLLFKLIIDTPNYHYFFIGPLENDANVSPKDVSLLSKKLFSFPNVHYLSYIPKNEIKNYLEIFDIAIIPYDIKDDFNRLCYPMKLFEYFSVGKPVISTPIETLKKFSNLVYLSPTAMGWKKHIQLILTKTWPKSKKILSQKLAQKNSWKNKVTLILRLAS